MKELPIIFLLLIFCKTIDAQFTFNCTNLCLEAQTISDDKKIDYNFILNKVLPALKIFSANGNFNDYNTLISCTDLIENLYKFNQNDTYETLQKKLEARFKYEMIDLEFNRNNDKQNWSTLLINKISSDLAIIKVAYSVSEELSKKLKKEKLYHLKELKKELLFSIKDDLKFAANNCTLFSDNEIEVYNNYIFELSQVDNSINLLICKISK